MAIVELDIDATRPDLIRVRKGVAFGPNLVVVLGLSLISSAQIVAWHLIAGFSLAVLIPAYAVVICFLTAMVWIARWGTQAAHPSPPVLLCRPSTDPLGKWRVWNERIRATEEYDEVLDIRLDRVRSSTSTRHLLFTHVSGLIVVGRNAGQKPHEVLIAMQPWAPRLKARLPALRSGLSEAPPEGL